MPTKKYCTLTEHTEILRERPSSDGRYNKPYDTQKLLEYSEKYNYPHTMHLRLPEVQSHLLKLSMEQKLHSVFYLHAFL
jgi:hypothetical protein